MPTVWPRRYHSPELGSEPTHQTTDKHGDQCGEDENREYEHLD